MELSNWELPSFPLQPDESGFYKRVTNSKGQLRCPNCGEIYWIEGPEGGAAQNIQCSSCFKYYNDMGPFGLHDIEDRSNVWGNKKGA